MKEKNRKSIESCLKLPQFTTMNVIDGQAGLVLYSSFIFDSLTINNILNIVVLIILAGVAINLTLGENGILKRAENAREQSDEMAVREKVETAIVEVQVEELTDTGRLSLKKLYENLSSKDSNITLNEYTEGDTTLTGTYTLNGKTYNIVINDKFKVEVGDEAEVEVKPVQVGDIVWNADGTVSIETSTELTGNIEYQVNGTDGEWLTGPLPTDLEHGDKLYVRVNDGTTATEPQEIEIKDEIDPEEFTISVPENTITYDSFEITSTGTEDKQSGIRDYSFIVTTKDGTEVEKITGQDVTEYEVEELSPDTEYVAYMIAYDKAGNERKSNEVKVTTLSIPVVETFTQPVNYSANGIENWSVFYIEDDSTSSIYENIYIIADSYLPIAKIPITNTKLETLGTYGGKWLAIPTLQNYNNTLFMTSRYTLSSSYTNSKCVSTMLNTENWSAFANGTSGNLTLSGTYAIGGPTIEMWTASWNDKYPSETISIRTRTHGYQVNGTYQASLSTNASTYIVASKSGCSGYWLASPSVFNSGPELMVVNSNGNITTNGYNSVANTYGFRPVVCIPGEDYKLQYNSETSKYDIVAK